MSPISKFLVFWLAAGFITLVLEFSKYGNFWRKFDELEKAPEARYVGGPGTFIISGIVVVILWPVRVRFFIERLVKFLWTKTK